MSSGLTSSLDFRTRSSGSPWNASAWPSSRLAWQTNPWYVQPEDLPIASSFSPTCSSSEAVFELELLLCIYQKHLDVIRRHAWKLEASDAPIPLCHCLADKLLFILGSIIQVGRISSSSSFAIPKVPRIRLVERAKAVRFFRGYAKNLRTASQSSYGFLPI